MSSSNFIDILLAIILPPLGVFLKFGCGAEFWICLLLTILGYIPGIIYAVYIITKEQAEFWICLLLTILGYIPGIIYAVYIITK
ncbi:hypothetical protein SADUNF_Sadunf13G0001600 [Salix dunnii]|uniref:Uncharacterized protein n=1 Tax=Salix dunnii TaxID=1413687 RepID=A0A835JFP1_9ROSI|nr:hypothetical protein SADUNF_Sadunf13G0001600 [Salix dunnii]